jgi:hypothetical protein
MTAAWPPARRSTWLALWTVFFVIATATWTAGGDANDFVAGATGVLSLGALAGYLADWTQEDAHADPSDASP